MPTTTAHMITEARKAGVEITVTTRPEGTGRMVPLPGLHRQPEDVRT